MLQRLRDRRPRVGCLVVAVAGAAALAAGLGMAFSVAVPSPPIPEPMARAALARERAAAVAAGLALEVERTEYGSSGMSRELPLSLSPGECVAVIAAGSGALAVGGLSIADAASQAALVEGDDAGGVARHAQWCADRAASWRATIEVHDTGGFAGARAHHGALHYAVLRGRPEAFLFALNRARPVEQAARGISSDVARTISDRLAGGRAALGPDLPIAAYRARLVPEVPATYAQLHAHAINGAGTAVTPRFDPLPAGAPDAWRPIGAAPLGVLAAGLSIDPRRDHPAVAFVGGEPRRVLAVIDPSAFPGRCARVHFVRLLYGFEARVERAGGQPLARDRNVAMDRLCGGGAQTYLAPADDRERYLLRVFPEG